MPVMPKDALMLNATCLTPLPALPMPAAQLARVSALMLASVLTLCSATSLVLCGPADAQTTFSAAPAATLQPIPAQAPLQTPQHMAAATPTPQAGDVLRDTPLAPTTLPALPDAPAPTAPSANPTPPAARFVLRALQVQGSTVLSPAQVQQLAEPYVGQTLSDAELGALITALRQRYEAEGYTLASVGFPTQDVSQGTLRVDVIEPRLGRVQTPVGPASPVSERRMQGLLGFFNLQPGSLLNTQALERVMFALNDMPGVQAKASLSPAGDEGVYNLSIQTQARRWWDATLAVDNQGIGEAGRWRTTGMVRVNNPLGLGDNIDLQTLLSNTGGVKVGRLAYELPVGYTPARLAVAYAQVGYALGGQFAAYGANGTAKVWEANLSYPLMRSRHRTLIARLGAEQKDLRDKLDSFDDQTDKRVRGAVAGLSFESRDGWLGGGFNGASVQLHTGQLSLGSQAQRSQDAALGDAALAGHFSKTEWQLSRLQGVTRTVSAYVAVSQQLASRNLDSAEKMSLGGPRGVRAYPTAEGASDEATLLNTELRWWLDSHWTVFALYDWARGRRNRDGGGSDNSVLLHGSGLGLMASYPEWATVKATLAWRGKREAETDSGHDRPRLYLQAQHTF
jgi:hemolysin activation/secretion protein